MLFCTQMRAVFRRDVNTRRVLHQIDGRDVFYILLTYIKLSRRNPEQLGASARRVMTSRSGLGGSKLKVHLASPPDRPTVSARHGFRLGSSDRPTRRAQRGGAKFELFWVGRPDRPTLFHRQRWVGSRFSVVSANFTRPTDPPAPDSPLSGWVGPPARPTLSAAAPVRKVYFQLRTAHAHARTHAHMQVRDHAYTPHMH